jgi:hypothetical protein
VELARAKKLIQDAKKKEKAAYGNMFSKISVYDDKEVPVVSQLSSPSNSKVSECHTQYCIAYTGLC